MKSTTFLFILSFLFTPVAYAQTSSTSTTTTSASAATDIAAKKKAADDALTAYKAATAANKLVKLQTLGDKLIDHRLASMNDFITRLTERKGLTAPEITAIKTAAQPTLDGLATLKSKIDADTDLATAKTDVLSIFSSYRVYAVLLPKLHLMVIANQEQSIVDSLTALTPNIQAAIDAKKAGGEDVTALTAALTDYTNQLATASKDLASANSQITTMVASNVEASKTAFTSARDLLKTVRASLVAARGDLGTIRDDLKPATSPSTKSTTSGATTTTTP